MGVKAGNCPGSSTRSGGVATSGPKGYQLFGPGYSYVWSSSYAGTYAPPDGKCTDSVNFWLFNVLSPTTDGYYAFGPQVTAVPGARYDCPKTSPILPKPNDH